MTVSPVARFWRQSFNSSGVLTRWSTKDGDNYLGDHATPHGNEGSAGEEADLLNNCYVLYCARLMTSISAVLGNTTGTKQFAQSAEAHAIAIHKRFFNASIQGYVDTRQGHLILALISGAVPPHLLKSVLATLRHEIHVTQGGHIDTGLTTTYLMYKYFADSAAGFGGREDLAYTVTTAKGHPGYLAIIDSGSTTWPEHWGYCHDPGNCCMEADWQKSCCERVYRCKSYSGCTEGECATSAGASSKIHGTLNGVGQFFVSGIGGIRRPVGGVGYQTIEFRAPFFEMSGVTHARATYRSLHGLIESSWSTVNGVHHHNVTIPPNCVAMLRIPGVEVWESGVLVQTARDGDGTHVVMLGSGDYAVSARHGGQGMKTDDLLSALPRPIWTYDHCAMADGTTCGRCGPGCDQCGPAPPGASHVDLDASRFHINGGRCQINDPDGPFFDPRHGVYHVFNQYHNAQPSPQLNGSASVVWAHHVSRDLAHWATMPVPLWNDSPWDVGGLPTGSTTVLDDGQVRIVYPGGCNCNFPSCKWSCQVSQGSGTGPNGEHGGGTYAVAEPANTSDPLLTRWSKPSYNPVFPQSTQRDDANQVFADSSTAWKTPHGEWRFVGANPNYTVAAPRPACENVAGCNMQPLFGSTDGFRSFHMIGYQKNFTAGECPSLFPLPRSVADAAPALPGAAAPNSVYKCGPPSPHYGKDVYTHGYHVDGEPGKLGIFIPYGSQTLDTGPGRTYASKDFADPVKGRRLLWGWGPGSVLTLPREILWHPELQQLVFAPIEETALLRVPIVPPTHVSLASNNGSTVVKMLASSAVLNGTAEVLLNITRPSRPTTFGIALSTNLSATSGASVALGLYIYISYAPPTVPGMPYSVGLGIADLLGSKSRNTIHESFALSEHDRSLSLRIYKDLDLLEIFWQGGRVVKTLRGGGGDVVAMVTSGEMEGDASVWSMASSSVSPEEVLRVPRMHK
jgi:sucrose-6-phosphate hydrolase SacC (GH32 family)